MQMEEEIAPPSSMKLSSRTERHWTRQWLEEKQERQTEVCALWARCEEEKQERQNAVCALGARCEEEKQERQNAVSALWARFEEFNHQIQALQSQPRPTQAQPPPALPAVVQDSLIKPGCLHTAATAAAGAAYGAGDEVNREVAKEMEEVQALMQQINQSRERLRLGASDLTLTGGKVVPTAEPPNVAAAAAGSGTGGSLEEPPDTTAAAIAALRASVQKLDTEHQEQVKENSYIKGMLVEVHIGAQLHAIRATRVALQSVALSSDERNQAMSVLEKKELDCKSSIRQVCKRPQLDELMAVLASQAG